MAINKKPLVSVIVPIYNSGNYLRRCMDSLIYQTLEDIEIIAVNNGSTDDSLEILKEYQNNFSEKVLIHNMPHSERAGRGRNLGIANARSDYIYFCDSDDMVHYYALEYLYKKAISENSDIVFAPYYRILNSTKTIRRKIDFNFQPNVEDLLFSAEPSLWTKLIHRELIEKAGNIPEDFSFEDLAYTFVLHTKAERISYLDFPIYYYFQRNDSEVHTLLNPRLCETINAELYGLYNCNPKYRDCVLQVIAQRIVNNINVRWVYADKYIEHLMNLWEEIERTDRIINNIGLYNNLKKYVNNAATGSIPRKIYIDGFKNKPDEAFLTHIKENAFYDDCEIVILSEQICDITENKIVEEAYNNKNYEFVMSYFAIKSIYEYGGIYLDHRIIIDTPFNYTRYFNAFFGFIDKSNYTDWVYGGKAGNSIIGSILKTYDEEGFYEDKYYPLYDRIKNILTGEVGIPLNGATNLYGYPVTVFAPSVLVADINSGASGYGHVHICSHDFSGYIADKGYVTIKKSTLDTILNVPGGSMQFKKLKLENMQMKRKLKEIETSNAWKLSQFFKLLSRQKFIGKPIKWLFFRFKNIYNILNKY